VLSGRGATDSRYLQTGLLSRKYELYWQTYSARLHAALHPCQMRETPAQQHAFEPGCRTWQLPGFCRLRCCEDRLLECHVLQNGGKIT
jgi:hypothetical protein